MKEEMEEGHFDKEGMYIFGKREKDEIKDHWLDNIDWVKVNSQTTVNKTESEEESMGAVDYFKKFDPVPVYKEILNIVLPGETILKALKRLGGGKVQTASERWKKKKQNETAASEKNEMNKAKIAALTEHANSILSNLGNMDVYQETFEGIQYKVQQAEASHLTQKSSDDMDMFGEVFNEEKKKAESELPESDAGSGEPSSKKVRFNEENEKGNEDKNNPSDDMQWEFKWENDEKAEIHGPHSSSEMQNWVSQGYFESGVWVRRVGQQGDFYTSRRIDFELYL